MHARDYNTTGLDKRRCDSLTVTTDEAAATLAEIRYRASRRPPLPSRQTYSGLTLPKDIKDCDKRPDKVSKRPPGCTIAVAASAGGGDQCDPDLPTDPDRGRPAMSNGDPHLLTLDARAYDFQAVGEFVAVESDSGDLVIQARQSPYPGDRLVSLNTSIALRVGEDRLQFAVVDGDIAVWLNGQQEDWEPGACELPAGGKAGRRPSPITFGQDGYTVRWPDGSLAWMDVIGAWGLRLYVHLPPGREGTVHGLLGDFDGDPANDLRPRDGEPLANPMPRS